MFRLLLNSFSTKLLSAVFSFAIVLLTTHFLGAAGRGDVAIITASINLFMLIHSFVGSSAIVYLTPRKNFYQLLLPSYAWALLSSLVMYFLSVFLIDVFSGNEFLYGKNGGGITLTTIHHVILLSFISSLFEMNALVLLGKEKIVLHNVVSLLRILILMLALFMFFTFNTPNVTNFIHSMYVGYIAGFVMSTVCLFTFKESLKVSGWVSSTKAMLQYGFQDQVSVILHFLNYRIATYALFFMSGNIETGIFSVVTFLMEGVLMVSNSFSLVQYSKVVNSTDSDYNNQLTIVLFKITFVLLTVGCFVISVIPSSVYEFVIGKSFVGVNYYFALLSPGLIAYGSTIFFNNYFCGLGKFYENILSNALGLVVSLIGCFFVIPKYGIEGACIIISATYLVVGLYLLLKYIKVAGISGALLLPRKRDIKTSIALLKGN